MAEKEGEKKEKAEAKEFTVGLQPVYKFPRPRRARKAITLLKRFVFKHLRIRPGGVLLSNKVNEELWKHGREHVPRKIEIKVIESKGKANVFLKGEKVELPKKEEKGKKEKKKEEKKTEAELEAEKEAERKKEEKKMVEKAAEAAAMKRGTQ